MQYIKKLALVAVLAVAALIWFPVLALRGVFAALNWVGLGMRGGLRHRDSGLKLVSLCGLALFGPVWLLSIGAILALASYEIAMFKLMNALYACEDIGYRPRGETPQPQRGAAARERLSLVQERDARVLQLPSTNQVLTEVQAMQVAMRNGWNPPQMDYGWDSRRQCWRSKDGQLVDMTGAHIAWAS